MYVPSHFKIDDLTRLYALIDAHSFATVISQVQGHPFATHIPLLLDPATHILYGHFARPNPQWQEIEDQETLVIFQGHHGYISPSWYGTASAVPTWNYTAVHVYGKAQLMQEEEEVLHVLQQLTRKYEESNSPYNLDAVDPAYLAGLSKGIQGFKLPIARIEGKAKLSQNHPIERQERIVAALEQKGCAEREIAAWMRENLK
ncbi:transcriptional regulator [Paenibacillus pectinilyticus]|uniref:Transcriptional regulator n=1 Tax=Paenibacillus pectinilyticus TaxID=512399 RepID=A0A1C1A6R1_9BACL|nr:FMN-binding negative transcriptional regulator [Paenibacillus pectinilyticus]OCT16253.1 transcriptional regulator [Paenibacillus pectinilyticus]